MGSIKITAGQHNEKVSDHKPIFVEIENGIYTPDKIMQRDMIIDRGKLKQSSRFLLQDLVDAENLESTFKAFEDH